MNAFRPQKIVVPVDFSDFSFGAVEKALEIAGDAERVHLIHVLLPISVMEPGVLYGEITDVSRVESTEKTLRDKFPDAKHAGMTIHAVVGDPGQRIAEYAARESAELIVLPSHGHGFFKHLMLGSVAERAVRLAHCPVLVLKTEPED